MANNNARRIRKQINRLQGERFKNARERLGLTQEELGNVTEVSTQKISRMERGVSAITDEFKVVLYEKTGIEPNEIVIAKLVDVTQVEIEKVSDRKVLLYYLKLITNRLNELDS